MEDRIPSTESNSANLNLAKKEGETFEITRAACSA